MTVADESAMDTEAGGSRSASRRVEKAIRSLERSPRHLFVLEVWQADVRALVMERTDVVEDMRRLRGELYQIISISLIFEGVILTAVAQTQNLNCDLWWSPALLAILIAFPASCDIFAKSRHIRKREDDRDLMDKSICAIMKAIQKLHLEEPSQEEEEDMDMDMIMIRAKCLVDDPSTKSGKGLSVATLSVIGLIIVFSIVVVVFSRITLCRYCPGCKSAR